MTTEEKKKLFKELNEEFAKMIDVPLIRCKLNVEWAARRTYGQCTTSLYGNEIKISKFIKEDKDIRNTMVHELCHLYNVHKDGHNHYWKQIAKKASAYFNTEITRCSHKELTEEGKNYKKSEAIAQFVCPNCGRVHKIFRRGNAYKYGKGYYRCGVCGTVMEFERY